MESRKKLKIFIYAIGILGIILIIKYNLRIPCVFHELTGLYCPGCGATRAINSLVRLKHYQAFRYNMLIIILIPFFVIYLLTKEKFKIPNWIWYTILIITILFGILRNIPYFSFLAPTML